MPTTEVEDLRAELAGLMPAGPDPFAKPNLDTAAWTTALVEPVGGDLAAQRRDALWDGREYRLLASDLHNGLLASSDAVLEARKAAAKATERAEAAERSAFEAQIADGCPADLARIIAEGEAADAIYDAKVAQGEYRAAILEFERKAADARDLRTLEDWRRQRARRRLDRRRHMGRLCPPARRTAPRTRGAGRPRAQATRSSARSGDSGDDGEGDESGESDSASSRLLFDLLGRLGDVTYEMLSERLTACPASVRRLDRVLDQLALQDDVQIYNTPAGVAVGLRRAGADRKAVAS